MKSYATLLAFVFLLCACEQETSSVIVLGQEKLFKESSNVEIKLDSLLVSPTNLAYWNDNLVIADQMGKVFFVLVDLANKNRLTYFGKKGAAPNELLDSPILLDFQYLDDSLMYRSFVRNKLFRVPYKSGKFLFSEKSSRLLPDDIYRKAQAVIVTPDDFIVAAGGINHKLSIHDSNNKIVKNIPLREEEELLTSNILKDKMALQGHIGYQKVDKKIVYASQYLNLIEIYDLKGNLRASKFLEENLKKYNEPINDTDKYEQLEYHFVDLSANETYIAAIYIGKQLAISNAEELEQIGSKIILFDWDLNPKMQFEEKGIVSQVCISKDNQRIYFIKAVGENFILAEKNISSEI